MKRNTFLYKRPNAGGKIAMKTIGLNQMMLQSAYLCLCMPILNGHF